MISLDHIQEEEPARLAFPGYLEPRPSVTPSQDSRLFISQEIVDHAYFVIDNIKGLIIMY
jgi:hypothetical protein